MMSRTSGRYSHAQDDRVLRGRRHYTQAHRKTSLFGSENLDANYKENHTSEEKMPYKYEFVSGNGVKEARRYSIGKEVGNSENMYVRAENVDGRGESKNACSKQQTSFDDRTTQNYESDDCMGQEINHRMSTINLDSTRKSMNGKDSSPRNCGIVQEAKVRAESRNPYQPGRNSPIDGEIQHSKPPMEERCHQLSCWPADSREGMNSITVRKSTAPKTEKTSKLFKMSTSQQDYQSFTPSDIQMCRQPRNHNGLRESELWFRDSQPNDNTYRKSSTAIGESFMGAFGGRVDCDAMKRHEDTQVAVSYLPNTPYAQHK